MDFVIMVLRALLSLAVVLGLVWFASRRLSGQKGQKPGVRRKRAPRAQAISVVGRHSLGQKVGLALVDVNGERLLLGVSEHGVNVLTRGEVPVAEQEDFDEVLREELDLAALVNEDGIAESMSPVSTAMSPALTAPAHTAPELSELATPTAQASLAAAAAGSASSANARALSGMTNARTDVGGKLGDSILSPATWRRTLDVVRNRTVRR